MNIRQAEIDAVRASGQFDEKWYLEQYPDVKMLAMDPVEHYLWIGRRLGRRGSANEQYEAIKAAFDSSYHLYRYPDIARAKIDPVKHFIEHGAREGRNPSPEFHTKYYLARYPDVEKSGINPYYHWLTVGRAEGRGASPFSVGDPTFDAMCEIIKRRPKEVETDLIERRRDLRDRFENGALGEMVAKAAELEPLIAHSWRELLEVRLPPFHSPTVVEQVVAMRRLHEAAEFRRAKAVVLIPHCRLSGATRIAGYLAKALAEIYGADELIIVRTDLDIMQFPEWFPANCRQVNFAGLTERLGPQERQKLLVEFLRSVRPIAAFNVNSGLFWDTLTAYGKALSASMALYSYFFCNDKNVYGHWEGYPLRKFYRHFDVLSGVITDSHFLADDLTKRHFVPPSQAQKIVTLETPIACAPPVAPAPSSQAQTRPQIFWSGRFDRQKRVDIVYAIAGRLPEVDFRLWGEPILDNEFAKLKQPENVVVQGVYRDLAELPLNECDLWLYTSEWDGVPNILIEIAAAGVPLVGSLVGGTGEILEEGFSRPIANVETVDAYVDAIRETLRDAHQARDRAILLRERVLSRRTPTAYRIGLQSLLSTTLPAQAASA